MTAFDHTLPSSPAPGASPEESLQYYKRQYEILEAELAEFQQSSKDLEGELEKDIEQAEKRESRLKEEIGDLKYKVEEWKEKHKQAKGEATHAQVSLEREVKTLRQDNRELRQRLRDTEVANDDYERKQRTTEVSLEDMEQKYNQAIERSVMLEEEVRVGEQERENLRIETQRLKDEYSDFKVEAEVSRRKLEQLEKERAKRQITSHFPAPTSPRSEPSSATTDTSGPPFDTPPAKAISSGVSNAPTTPSSTPSSTNSNRLDSTTDRSTGPPNSATPRPLSWLKPTTNGHTRNTSIASLARTGPAYRQSLGAAPPMGSRRTGLPPSSSIVHLRNLRGKMQELEERVQHARSKLPAPTDTPPRGSPRRSPRSGSALNHYASAMPSSVTVRSKRRNEGSMLNRQDSDSAIDEVPDTPSMVRSKLNRPSLTGRPGSPTRGRTSMAAPPRPSSRQSTTSQRSSLSGFPSSQSRPPSRMSTSGLPLQRHQYAPNVNTDTVRPHSSLSSHHDQSESRDESDTNESLPGGACATPRAAATTTRSSHFGTAIPSPGKRSSIGGTSRLPAPPRRQSQGLVREGSGDMRPPSRNGGTGDVRPPSRDGEMRPPSARPRPSLSRRASTLDDLHETF